MSNLTFAMVGFWLILSGCANNNVVVVQAKPPSTASANWRKSWLIVQANAMQPELCKQPASPQVANQPGYQQLIISLESGNDTPPVKLGKNDLKIRHGNQEIAMPFFQQEAISVGILVDTSGSMDPKMRAASRTLSDLLDGLNPADEAFLMTFSSKLILRENFTTDYGLIKQQLAAIRPFGQTELRDAIVKGLMLLEQGCNQSRALFVMTDGIDNTSSIKASEMIAAVKESKVPIFALGIGEKRHNFDAPMFAGGDTDRVDVMALQALAEASGGKAYILPELGDTQAKQTALAIANGINNHYAVGFVAPANSKLQIELLNHPGATLKIKGRRADVTVVNLSQP